MAHEGTSAPDDQEDALSRLHRAATERTASLAATVGDAPPTEPQMAVKSTPDLFRLTVKVPGLKASQVSTEILADELVVRIRQTVEGWREDDDMREVLASSSSWERSFKLAFTPKPSTVRVQVAVDGVTVTARP
jgi:HSP20 family molecular chaperone IbpA